MKEKILGLDLIRAIAISLVVIYHSVGILQPFIENYYIIGKAVACTQVFGLLGVEIFYILSGFLIGGILIEQFGEKSLKSRRLIDFWGRRWFRTLPLYFIILLTILFLKKETFDLVKIKYFFFIQNLITPHPDFFPEAWSLSVEEWFYFMFPFVSFMFNKYFKTSIIKSVIIYIIIAFIVRVIFFFQFESSLINFDWHIRKMVILRLDAPMYGVILAYIYKKRNFLYQILENRVVSFFIIGISITSFLLLFTYLSGYYSFKNYIILGIRNIFFFPCLAISICLTFPLLMKTKIKNRVINITIITLAKISYSMYLIHYYLIYLTFFAKTNITTYSDSVFYFSMYISILILVSYLLHLFIEKPILKFRDKILPN